MEPMALQAQQMQRRGAERRGADDGRAGDAQRLDCGAFRLPGPCVGQAAEDLFHRQQALGLDELEQAEFEVEALLLAEVELVEGAEGDLEIAGEVFFGEEQRRCGRRGRVRPGRSRGAAVFSPPSLAMRQLRR